MPIYEYVCKTCRKTTEAIQRVGERPLRICPHCGGKLKKVASVSAIQFKGSGWYVHDYAGARGEQKKKEATADTKEGAGEAKEEAGEKAEKKEKADSEKNRKSKVKDPK